MTQREMPEEVKQALALAQQNRDYFVNTHDPQVVDVLARMDELVRASKETGIWEGFAVEWSVLSGALKSLAEVRP